MGDSHKQEYGFGFSREADSREIVGGEYSEGVRLGYHFANVRLSVIQIRMPMGNGQYMSQSMGADKGLWEVGYQVDGEMVQDSTYGHLNEAEVRAILFAQDSVPIGSMVNVDEVLKNFHQDRAEH